MNIESMPIKTFEITAFVREVLIPGSFETEPKLDSHSCLFGLEYKPSPIHRWGIFAAEPIRSRVAVIEYTGQKIGVREVWRRRIRQHLYIFWLDKEWAIDGGIGGSGAEFINHSCNPNLEARTRGGRIYFISKRRITAGEELTLDYNVDEDCPDIPCSCGTEQCRGLVNRSAGRNK